MEFNENTEEEYKDEEYVDIYSKKAIFWFSIFSYIYAGVLLIINLRAAGYRKGILQVLVFLVAYYLIASYIIILTGIKIDAATLKSLSTATTIPPAVAKTMAELLALSVAINLGGGLVLTQYFFKKYFPDDDYYPKPVLQPILILVFLMFLFRFIL